MVNMAAAIYCGVAEQLARWMRMGIRMAHCCAGALVSAFKRAGMKSISASTLPAMWQQFLPATNQLFLPDAADRGGVSSMSAGGNPDQLHLAIRPYIARIARLILARYPASGHRCHARAVAIDLSAQNNLPDTSIRSRK
jgi:hypothetical protein